MTRNYFIIEYIKRNYLIQKIVGCIILTISIIYYRINILFAMDIYYCMNIMYHLVYIAIAYKYLQEIYER